MTQLEALSEDVFAPVSEQEASLVVGGMAASEPIGVTYYDTLGFMDDGSYALDMLIVDEIYAI